MLPTLARRLALTAIRAQLPQAVKATKLKKVWPPDFTQLSAQEQLRFEKRYKRRMRLATQRPLWDKSVRLLQLFSVTAVVIYSVLFMDSNGASQPFEGVRKWFFGMFESTELTPVQRYERRPVGSDTTSAPK
ncbi:hypothetical protein P8C59_005786 [Phyllachora maydis]|uniref:Uncharacterized protein n=1 Tax=Phyllachora maydis TaxID=1825666 RepID=A0AAD9MCL2_9PEZI|nr:hypothetical protein P8C59_005786 [Phyllachora maydis]